MTTDSDLDREIERVNQGHATACGDVLTPFRSCRRELGHEGDHAAGTGANRQRWSTASTPTQEPS